MDNKFLENVEVGIVANLICTILLFPLGWFIYYVVKFLRRRRFQFFLGLNKNNLKISIYTSCIKVEPGTTKDAKGNDLKTGYVGPVFNQYEYKAALSLQKEVGRFLVPLISKRIWDMLSGKVINFKVFEPEINAAPAYNEEKNLSDILSQNLILIGSGIYNKLTDECLNSPASLIRFERQPNNNLLYVRARIKEGTHKDSWTLHEGRNENRELVIIQRLYNSNNRNTIIVCAGTGSEATCSSVDYLLKNWSKLKKHHQNNSQFAICLSYKYENNKLLSYERKLSEYPEPENF